jgi:hypothetical protein
MHVMNKMGLKEYGNNKKCQVNNNSKKGQVYPLTADPLCPSNENHVKQQL